MARLLYKTKNYQKAYEFLNEVYWGNDSIKRQEASLQLDELSSLYEVDKLTIEKEKLKDYLTYVIILVILICVILIIVIAYSIRIQKKNKVIYKSIVEDVEQFETTAQETDTDNERSKFLCALFQNINEVLEKEHLIQQDDLSRKILAEKLGSNPKYIADAIRENTGGKTVNEYINTVRLRYACSLLLKEDNLTLEAIALNSGFKSRSNFYTQFKSKYSMSPGAFKKVNKVEQKTD